MSHKILIVLLACGAFLTSACRINNGLVNSEWPVGPGLTLDESFNIGQGVYLFESFLDHGPMLFTPSTATDVFGARGYLPDHPPLARVVLGAAHQLTRFFISGAESAAMNVPAARLGSCFAFGLTVLLLGEFTRRKYGIATALTAGLCLLLMPRVVGHSRLAALETVTTLAWLAALVPVLSWWTGDAVPTARQCTIGGIFWTPDAHEGPGDSFAAAGGCMGLHAVSREGRMAADDLGACGRRRFFGGLAMAMAGSG